MDEKAEMAIGKLIDLEGGYVNDPKDAGGETKYGISRRSYPDLDIAGLTRERAASIYYNEWWMRYAYGGLEPAELAAKLLDLAVHMGPRTAHSMLQRALNETGGGPIDVDGVLGPATVNAVCRHSNPALLLARLRLEAVGYYARIGSPKYIRGWVRRALA